MMTETVDRIFFHELGHLIAHEMNYIFYKAPAKVDGAKIYPCDAKADKYCGHVNRTAPKGFDENASVPLDRLPQRLASLSYGCLLQSCFQQAMTPRDCFSLNGWSDRKKLEESIFANNFGSNYFEPLLQLERTYFQQLKDAPEVQELIKLSPHDYLTSTDENTYDFKLDKIRKGLSSFITLHKPLYTTFVDKISEILQ